MAKKSMVERERKRQKLVAKFHEKRANLQQALKTTESFEEKFVLQQQLQKTNVVAKDKVCHKRQSLS